MRLYELPQSLLFNVEYYNWCVSILEINCLLCNDGHKFGCDLYFVRSTLVMYGFLIIYMDKVASRKNWNFIYILFINVRCSIIARLYVSVGWTTVLDSLLSTGMIVEYAERCPICAIAAVRSVLAGVVGMRMPWQFHKLIPYVCVCVCGQGCVVCMYDVFVMRFGWKMVLRCECV